MTISPNEFPSIAELIPHAGPMVLLDRVRSHTSEQTVCERTIRADDIFLNHAQRHVPVWIGIEYMAQCVAAHARLLMRDLDPAAAPQRGFLVGTRQIHFHTAGFPIGQCIQIGAKPVTGVLSFLAFNCEIRATASHELLVAGQIHLFVDRNTNLATLNNTKERISHE